MSTNLQNQFNVWSYQIAIPEAVDDARWQEFQSFIERQRLPSRSRLPTRPYLPGTSHWDAQQKSREGSLS
jgi:hypothetical protein